MARIPFSVLMFGHGLVHLFGFVGQWEVAQVSLLGGGSLIPVSEVTTRALGAGWFVAYVLFVLASFGRYRRRNWWMATTLTALAVSQTLIIFYWPNAGWGTLVNILIAVVLAASYSQNRFSVRAFSGPDRVGSCASLG